MNTVDNELYPLTQIHPDKRVEELNKPVIRTIHSCADFDGLRIRVWFHDIVADGVLHGNNSIGIYFWTSTNIYLTNTPNGYQGHTQRRGLGSSYRYLQGCSYYEFLDDVIFTKLPRPEELNGKRCIVTMYDGKQIQGIADCSYTHFSLWNNKNGTAKKNNNISKFLTREWNMSGGIAGLYCGSKIKVVEGTNEDFNPEDLAPNGKEIRFETNGDSLFKLIDKDYEISNFGLRRCSCCGIAEVTGFEQFYSSLNIWTCKDNYVDYFVKHFKEVRSLINKQKYGYCVFSVVKEHNNYELFDKLFPDIEWTKNPNSGNHIKSTIVKL